MKQSVAFIYLRKKTASSVGGNHRDPVPSHGHEMFPEAVGSLEKPACKISQSFQKQLRNHVTGYKSKRLIPEI